MKDLLVGISFIVISILLMTGVIQELINFESLFNEMLFTILSLLIGLFFLIPGISQLRDKELQQILKDRKVKNTFIPKK